MYMDSRAKYNIYFSICKTQQIFPPHPGGSNFAETWKNGLAIPPSHPNLFNEPLSKFRRKLGLAPQFSLFTEKIEKKTVH